VLRDAATGTQASAVDRASDRRPSNDCCQSPTPRGPYLLAAALFVIGLIAALVGLVVVVVVVVVMVSPSVMPDTARRRPVLTEAAKAGHFEQEIAAP
jgi:hypothetical protein